MPKFDFGMRHNPKVQELFTARALGDQNYRKYSVLSMFSGCGGMDLGFLGGFRYLDTEFSSHPFRILQAIDNDRLAIETYKLNIGDDAMVGDLTEISAENLPKTRVLIGGFPCQDFSSSGPKVGFAGARGLLYLSMIGYMRHHRPDVLIGENVPHIASLHKGIYLRKILEDIKAVGYNPAVWELFAPDFGVSQSRRRIIIIATRAEIGFPPRQPIGTFVSKFRPIEFAIDDLKTVTDEQVPNQSQYFVATKATSGGGQGDHKNKKGELAYCIRANAKARIQFHYDLERRLTVRECARIQSFPDEFVFPHSAMNNMTQIGNAVPPVLGWSVAKVIAEFLHNVDAGLFNEIPLKDAMGISSTRIAKVLNGYQDETQQRLFSDAS